MDPVSAPHRFAPRRARDDEADPASVSRRLAAIRALCQRRAMSEPVARAALPIDAPAAAAARLPLLDAARGAAVAAMIVYHFAWDLSVFRFISADVGADAGWVAFARAIAASFLFVSGVSLALADRGGLRPARFLRRLLVIALAAGAVTLATWLV